MFDYYSMRYNENIQDDKKCFEVNQHVCFVTIMPGKSLFVKSWISRMPGRNTSFTYSLHFSLFTRDTHSFIFN